MSITIASGRGHERRGLARPVLMVSRGERSRDLGDRTAAARVRRVVRAAARALVRRSIQINLHVGGWKNDASDVPPFDDDAPAGGELALTIDEHAADGGQPRNSRCGYVDFRRPDRCRYVLAVDHDPLTGEIERRTACESRHRRFI